MEGNFYQNIIKTFFVVLGFGLMALCFAGQALYLLNHNLGLQNTFLLLFLFYCGTGKSTQGIMDARPIQNH
jgi:ABC-type maltose transport system permease subunit